jgi:hypothetical protein
LAESPSIYTNGQEVGKICQRKNTHTNAKISWFRFLPSGTRTKHLAHSGNNLGGSDPVSTFGRQNRTNTGVAPAQIEVLVRGHFSELFAAVCSSTELCDTASVNGTPIFTGEHCVCSCVHP